jgi:hypothetical protein
MMEAHSLGDLKASRRLRVIKAVFVSRLGITDCGSKGREE